LLYCPIALGGKYDLLLYLMCGFRMEIKGKLSYDADSMRQEQSIVPRLNRELEGACLRLSFSGDWRKEQVRPELAAFEDGCKNAKVIVFTFAELGRWDSTLPVFIGKCIAICRKRKMRPDLSEAPDGLRRLMDFSISTVEDKVTDAPHSSNIFVQVGLWTIRGKGGFVQSLGFIGESLIGLGRLFTGRSRMRWDDFLSAMQACGSNALLIVTLISFLTGLTMAFVGGVQLEKFAAQIYMADLVGLAMVREMGALMVAIVMAGRTGAAFAAELGNMKVSEEIDSLRTLGISPFDFLVIPRFLALLLMIPLLTLYADVVGIIGGMAVGVGIIGFSVDHYLGQTETAITSMWEIYSGLVKSLVFGAIIGMVGCYKGMRCGASSSAVGHAVTSAVVTSITLVVIADALFEIIFSYLGWR
jgi:phospholipid/cholesterol/gamma-HCH transport system permease protein